jgi:2-polyprenyl-3-methyl-5-hydroxy-6-metoxy-1,4-benzoquinol methylase
MSVQTNERYTHDDHAFRENDPYAKAKYDLTLRWLRRKACAGNVLYNVGAGSGYFNRLAAAQGMRVVGCEPDPSVFTKAVAEAPAGMEMYNCGLEEFAHGRDPAPFLVMHDVLEHIEDDAGAARTLRSIVSDGGTVILSVPALMNLFGRHDEDLGHYRRYSAKRLVSVLEPHFVVQKLRWYGMISIPIVWYFSRWRRIAYPTSATRSVAGSVYGALCLAETYIREPIGTSLIAQLTPR